eukprot:Skav230190  [mRNA]  locus=scaffold1418:80587:83065:- [translate_table: standard]
MGGYSADASVGGIVGFRACVAAVGWIPATILNIVLPVVAVWRGDVALPNVMLSDVMASGPLYEAIYTWGFSISMVCVCFVFREASTFWRQKLPSMAPDVDRFVFMLYALCAPCLLGLVAFQYKQDLPLGDNLSSRSRRSKMSDVTLSEFEVSTQRRSLGLDL